MLVLKKNGEMIFSSVCNGDEVKPFSTKEIETAQKLVPKVGDCRKRKMPFDKWKTIHERLIDEMENEVVCMVSTIKVPGSQVLVAESKLKEDLEEYLYDTFDHDRLRK
jgi:hypothetical protein